MAIPTNILQQVQTYQPSLLGYLENLNCFVSTANTRFKDFNKLEANLGDSVTYDTPPRYTTGDGLVVTFQPSQQNIETLTVNKAKNIGYAFSAQQFIFNVEDYMDKFGKSAMYELSSQVEADIAEVALNSTYRFYGDGVTAINSFGQLAQMNAQFRNYGAVKDKLKVYLSDLAVPSIVNSGLQQFTPSRNDDLAMSWMVGDFDGANYYRSNLLPTHFAGTLGEAATTLTLVSTNDPTGANVTQLTFSGAGTSSTAALENDLGYFLDNVGSFTDQRYLTYIGHKVSGNPVQFRVTADAASSGGAITLNVSPALVWAPTNNQNLNTPLVAGMQVKLLPSHRAGLIVGGDALFLAMPRLPDQVPYPTSIETDSDTGVSLRSYYGSLFGQNQQGYVHDLIWGKSLASQYAMRICFPV